MKDEQTWLCGVKRKPDFEKIDDIGDQEVCQNCLFKAGEIDIVRQETFKSYIVRKMRENMTDLSPEKFNENMESACTALEKEMSKYQAVCKVEIEQSYINETTGRVVIEAGGAQYYLRFTYKPARKNQLHFESAARHYLTLPIHLVLTVK